MRRMFATNARSLSGSTLAMFATNVTNDTVPRRGSVSGEYPDSSLTFNQIVRFNHV